MLAMMLLTALLGGVVLTAPPDSPGPHCQLGQVPYVPPYSGRPSSAQDGDSRKRDGAITGPSVPLGQSELIIGTERIVGLKLFEPKTICPFLAVRDREARWPGLVWPCGSRST
jgi:hypothetical protein